MLMTACQFACCDKCYIIPIVLACCVFLQPYCNMSYPGSVILVLTHSSSNSAQNIVPALRRSAVSVRDICHSPRSAVTSANSGGQSPAEMEFAESSIMGKRLSASTNQLGTTKAQKLSKGTSWTMDSKHVIDTLVNIMRSILQHDGNATL